MFRRVLILAALVLGCGVSVSAQGFRIGDAQSITSSLTSTSAITPLQASIAVCVNPANAVPCTNKASTFTSITLATPCSAATQVVLAGTTTCVTQTDVRGNWGAWVAAGNYDYTVTLSTGQSFGPFTISVGIPAGTVVGNVIFNGTVQCKQFLTVACVDGSTYALTSAGVSQAITDLLARSPNGGEVWTVPGSYTISSTIANHKNNVTLRCLGAGGGWTFITGTQNSGSCALNWTGPASATIANSPAGATSSGTTVTITTTSTCTFATGDVVVVANVGVTLYNGNWVVLSPGCNGGSSFTYTNQQSGLASSGGGTVGEMMTDWSEAVGNSQPISGGGIEGFDYECNNSAAIGSHIANIFNGWFVKSSAKQCTSAGIRMDTMPITAGARATQHNNIQDWSIDETGTTGGRCLWDGSYADVTIGGLGQADPYSNFIGDIRCKHLNGDAFFFDSVDNDRVYDVGITRGAGGTGIGLHLTGAVQSAAAREMTFHGFDPGAGGTTEDGAATGNLISGITNCNGGGIPTVNFGILAYFLEDCGTNNNIFGFGTPSNNQWINSISASGNLFSNSVAGDLGIRTSASGNCVDAGGGTGSASLRACAGALYLADNSAAGGVFYGVHITNDSVALVAGTATVTLSGVSVYSSGTSYTCFAKDITTPANVVTCTQTSGSSITLTGTGTDTVRFFLIGS